MVTTNDHALWSAMWSYKDHGKSWEAVYERQHPPGPRLVHDTFGTHWRMLEMQAAIGLIQTRRMPEWTARRTEIASRISSVLLRHRAVRLPEVPNYARHGYYRLYAFARPEALAAGWTRDRIIDEIVARGVPCMHGSQSEVYLEGAFAGTGWAPQDRLPVVRALGSGPRAGDVRLPTGTSPARPINAPMPPFGGEMQLPRPPPIAPPRDLAPRMGAQSRLPQAPRFDPLFNPTLLVVGIVGLIVLGGAALVIFALNTP